MVQRSKETTKRIKHFFYFSTEKSFWVSDLVHRDAETQSILCINEDMREMSPDHDSLAVVDIQSGLRNLYATA